MIRELQKNDLEKLALTFQAPWSNFEKTLDQWKTYYAEQMSGNRSVYLIEKDDAFLGYCSLLRYSLYPYFSINNIPEINSLWIAEPYRKQGLATLIIKYIENKAREEGYQSIGLGVGLYKDYGDAQRLYYKLGFTPDGNGISYNHEAVIPGNEYKVDDELLLWMKKLL